VLNSVSPPITKHMYNMALDWFQQEPRRPPQTRTAHFKRPYRKYPGPDLTGSTRPLSPGRFR
jgi:hypothetical protein